VSASAPPVPAPGRSAHRSLFEGFSGLDSCVHCGFCLPACPTYEVTSDEADSPRGRIVLMKALARGEIPADDAGLQEHLDHCLGCRGCESVCPSGVAYGPALEAARAVIAQVRRLPAAVSAALWVLARPERQRLLWLAARLLRGTGLPARLARGAGPDASRAAAMLAMLAATKQELGIGDWGPEAARTVSARNPQPPAPRPQSPIPCLFRGCIMDGLFGHVHDATITALGANGVAVREVPGQVCCGALHAHAGAHGAAQDLARANVRAFGADGAPIVVNSAGCGAMLRSYGDLLVGDPLEADARRFAARVRDVTELLAECGPRPGHPLALKVAYDAPCHLLHAQKVADAPLRVLGAIPGLELVPLEGSERCCGSAGLYSLIEPEMSQDVLALKLAAIRRAAPDVIATGNPGCLMQIGAGAILAGLSIEVRHPVELLAWSYGT
jgi:glycolate oxidase iron-sulfur subunit